MGSPSQSFTATAFVDDVSPSDVRQQLDRILRSEAFSRSRRCQAFLSFISQVAIAGEESTINEHMIGIEVFGRGPEYNPGEDGVVRRQAHSVRQRLEVYYQAEGKDDPILIEMPVGHYVPVFRRRKTENVSPAETPPAPALAMQKAKPGIWAWVAVVTVAAVAAFAAGRLTSPKSAATLSPPLQELWGPWLAGGEGPLICFSSPPVANLKHYATQLPAGSTPPRSEITGHTAAWFRESLGLGPKGYLYLSPDITGAKAGEALSAVALANFFAKQGLDAQGALSRLMTWEEFRRRNIIVFGHNEQNKLVDPLLDGYPLQLRETNGEEKRRIINTNPAPGEQAFFEIQYADEKDEATVEHALVSMLPGTDRRHQLLIVSGLNTQATLMSIEFLTDPQRVQNLLGQMRASAPQHAGPWYFQMVLRTDVRDKVPVGANVEMIRLVE